MYPDPPTLDSMRKIYPYLNIKASIYVIQEIPQRNDKGVIMHIPNPANRIYQKIQINEGADSGIADIYIIEEVGGSDPLTRRPNMVYNPIEGNQKTKYDIDFERNSNKVSDISNNYTNMIKKIAQQVNATGEVIDITGVTKYKNNDKTFHNSIDGKEVETTPKELADARTCKIYDDLIDAGVNEKQLNIAPNKYQKKELKTSITVQEPLNLPMQNDQIKNSR